MIVSSWHRLPPGLLPSVMLVLLAPLVGEFLLGNISIRHLAAWPFLAPLYGGGALLIREVTRRTGRGWPTILLLGAAYGLLQAGLVDRSLFNPSFEGYRLTVTYLSPPGISAYYTLAFVIGHAVWSISVPIMLTEAVAPSRLRFTPWLGRAGLAVVVALYLTGAYLAFYDSQTTQSFRLPVPQAVGTLLVAAAIVAAAVLVSRIRPARTAGRAPHPLLAGVLAFAASAIFFTAPTNWFGVALAVLMIVVAALVVARLSRRAGWGDVHRTAVAGGALLTYALGGFAVGALQQRTHPLDIISQVVFALGALALLAWAVHRTRRDPAAG